MGSGTRPRVLYIGDSKTMGYNVLGTGYTNGSANSITKKIADLCNAAGLPANKDLAFCHQGASSMAVFAQYDPRFAVNSWSFSSDTNISGNAWRSVSPNVDSLAFSPAGTVDTVTVWYNTRSSSTGIFTVSDGATIVGTQTSVGTAAFSSVTYSLDGRGAGKTININRTTGLAQPINIAAIIAYDSTIPAMDIMNVGRFGTKASVEWLSTSLPWSAVNAIPTLNPHLSVINLGSNDLAGSVSSSTFSTSMQTIINACKAGGRSVVLINPTKGLQPTYGDATAQAAYTAVIKALALSNDVPMIDEGAAFVDFATANARSWFSDSIHENAAGTDIRAALHAQLLLAA